MSLPLATKEISSKPGANSVTSPTDVNAMQADVDRKMRLYGVIEAFRLGKLPNNKQIDETLNYVLDHSPVDEKKLSREGQKLVSDARDIIETARLIVQQKNSDEVAQNFLHDTIHNEAEKPNIDSDAVPVTTEEVKKDGRQAVEHLRTLLSLLLTNSEARKLLSDVSLIGRDLFARGAVHAAEKVRPDQEELARADDAAPSEEWKGADGQRAGKNETPVADVAGITHDPRNPDPKAATSIPTTNGSTNLRDQPSSDEARERAFIEKENGKAAVQNEAEEFRAEIENSDDKVETAKRGIKDRLFGLKEKIPEEHRQRAGEQYDKGVQFLKDEFPEERRDQFIYRLKKVIVECQKHSDYQEALSWFLSSFGTYFSHGRNLAEHGANATGSVTDDPSLQRASSELRTLLERFANGKSLDGILDAGRQLSEDAQNDEGLREWFNELDTYVHKTLLEPGYVMSPACNNEGNRLRDTGRQFFDEKYKGHKDNLFDQVQAWFVAWSDDPLNKRFGQDWKRLTRDLLFAEDGGLQYKPHLWNDIRKVIVPALVNDIGYIPIPRIEYTDNQLDLVIENLTLQGANILPNIVSIDAHNFLEFSPYASIPDRDQHDFTFTFSQIQADMRDVAFYFNKKTGLPKMKDSGLADVFLGGEGLTVKVHITGAGKDTSSVFKVKDVNVKVDSLKFSVRDTKHDILYKTLKPLATGLVKKQISKAIEDAIRTGLEFVDEQLVTTRDRMAEARNSDDTSTRQALASLFDRKVDDAASKAESKKAKHPDAQFKIVSKRDSVLIPQGHESGWINKQAERQVAAKTGEGWHSDAFNIVNITGTGPANKGAPGSKPLNANSNAASRTSHTTA